jgi:pyruvate formate lyase activating enzyme
MYDSKKCVACGRCAAVCPRNCHSFDEKHAFGRKLCIGCGACAEVCPAKALEIYGKYVTADEVYDEVKRDKVFYETSGGGVTISGGEPLFQPEFTAELLRKCRENGMKIVPWTVDKPEDITRILDLKVDAIISNYPDRVLQQTRGYLVP